MQPVDFYATWRPTTSIKTRKWVELLADRFFPFDRKMGELPVAALAAYSYDAFGWRKSMCNLTPPFTWSVTTWADTSHEAVSLALYAEVQGLAPLTPPALMSNIQFKRDYIGTELEKIQDRGLTPYAFTIDMYSN